MTEDRSVSDTTGVISPTHWRISDGDWNMRSPNPVGELFPLRCGGLPTLTEKTRRHAVRRYSLFKKISSGSKQMPGPVLVRAGWMLWLAGTGLTVFLMSRVLQGLEAVCPIRGSPSEETLHSVLARLVSPATFATFGALYLSSLSIGGLVMTAVGALLIKVGRDAPPGRHPNGETAQGYRDDGSRD